MRAGTGECDPKSVGCPYHQKGEAWYSQDMDSVTLCSSGTPPRPDPSAERQKREMELAQRKEAAAKALLEREKKKAEQDKAEIERLRAQLEAVTRENEELRGQAASQAASRPPAALNQSPSQPELKQPEVRFIPLAPMCGVN